MLHKIILIANYFLRETLNYRNDQFSITNIYDNRDFVQRTFLLQKLSVTKIVNNKHLR